MVVTLRIAGTGGERRAGVDALATRIVDGQVVDSVERHRPDAVVVGGRPA